MVAIDPNAADKIDWSAGAPEHPQESMRIQALCSLGILDTPAHERFDRLTRLATKLFDVPIALVSLVDTDRQWFKSRVGVDAPETPREESFCAHALLTDAIMVVCDARQDVRFKDNPLVLGPPDIRFYAGCPIKGPKGLPIGTLCVIDKKPRDFQAEDLRALKDLADIVEQEIRVHAHSTMDELTGITNRRGLELIAPHVLAFCSRMQRPATLLMFDLNGFKAVNDTHGHAAGDRVLQGFAQALLETFRDSDVVARLGGDEFCVLLSGASEDQARARLDELGEQMAKCVGPHPVSFSAGITPFDPMNASQFSVLLEDADRRMYADKRRQADRGVAAS